MTIFLDANILFSGSNPDSHLHRFLLRLNATQRLCSSHYAILEAERNILVKRPLWHQTYTSLLKHVRVVSDHQLTVEVRLPEKDKPILGAAIASNCRYLLTGDKHDFGHLYGQQVEGVTIIDSPSLATIIFGPKPDRTGELS
jgi:hypothetical protein